VDRELIELLNELRVALPGVQVLFAFLLVVPFQQAFGQLSEIGRNVYFAGLFSSAIAIAFLILRPRTTGLTSVAGSRRRSRCS